MSQSFDSQYMVHCGSANMSTIEFLLHQLLLWRFLSISWDVFASSWIGLLSATMSTSTRTPPLSPAVGHVILVVYLFPDTELCDSLYLEVPIHAATTVCFICAKYLAFLGAPS